MVCAACECCVVARGLAGGLACVGLGLCFMVWLRFADHGLECAGRWPAILFWVLYVDGLGWFGLCLGGAWLGFSSGVS